MKRVLFAGLLGAIAMFAWTSIAHMVLPLGATGVKEIPNEGPVLAALQAANGSNAGLYMYPGMGLGPNPSTQQMREAMPAYENKLKGSPSGILVYHPPGRPGMTGTMLGIEFGKEFFMVLLTALLLSMTRLASYGSKVGFFAVVGIVATLTTNVSYWNWYGFPTNYTLAYMFVDFMGFVAAGLVAAALVRNEA